MSLNGQDAYEQNYVPHLPADRDAPILDVGCGTGDFLAYLETLGYRNLRGVEIDLACIEASQRRTHAVIDQVDELETYLHGLPDRYALVTLKSVIAHFPRHRVVAYLRAIRNVLAPDGTLVVETFNASRCTGPYVLFNDLTHHWAYTEYSLKEILEAAGLRVVILHGERLSSLRLSTVVFRNFQRAWNAILRCIYLLERGIGRNPTILSKYLVAVCRKNT